MDKSNPAWASEKLSRELSVLRARGECQDLEFIEFFPENTRELGKEIAAFASTNSGMILIGVSNEGDLKGIDGLTSLESRDNLLHRIEGICRNTVKPSITPIVNFAIENGRIVLVLSVPKGLQPVYYCNHIPYVRNITESRPAEPNEVIKLVQGWLASRFRFANGGITEESLFYAQLARILTIILILGDEVEKRNINPWLDLLMAEFENASNDLRELASKNLAEEKAVMDELERLAIEVDQVGHYNHTLSKESWENFVGLVHVATEHASHLKRERIDVVPLPPEVVEASKKTVIECNRSLEILLKRSQNLIENGRIGELQVEASNIGLKLLMVNRFGLDRVSQEIRQDLHDIGMELHQIEMMHLLGDRDIERFLKKLSVAKSRLENLIIKLKNAPN